MLRLKILFIASVVSLLSACSSTNSDDLKDFIRGVHAKPRGVIEPLPVFDPYESFLYSATSMRSPFSPPVEIEEEVAVVLSQNVKPNFDRIKEHLEQFAVGTMEFVGSLQKENGLLWGLVTQGAAVHKVKEGYYLGHNHGRVIQISAQRIKIIEIVSNGQGGWMERPRTLGLKGIDGE